MLEIKEEEMTSVVKEFDIFLNQIEQLNLIETKNVDPINYPFETPIEILREDIPQSVLSIEDVLKNTEYTDQDMVKIPTVIT